jgi:hypothetical protein
MIEVSMVRWLQLYWLNFLSQHAGYVYLAIHDELNRTLLARQLVLLRHFLQLQYGPCEPPFNYRQSVHLINVLCSDPNGEGTQR